MSTMTRNIRCALAVAGFALFASTLNGPPVLAASKTAKAAPTQGEAAQGEPAAKGEVAKRAYEGGAKAYSSGKYQNAVDQLNVAMKAGGLGATDMAKGLYYRGLAYKKLNKPGLAISDLTSALWLKNGLSDAERQSATAERAEAYKAAGIAESENIERSPPAATPAAAAASPAKPVAAAQPAPVAVPAATAGAISPSVSTSAASAAESFPQPLTLGGESAATPPPKYARTDDKVTTGGAINQAAALEQPYSSTPASPAAAQPVLSAAPMQQPAPATGSAASSSGGSGISGFFSNIFGGPSSPAQAPAAMQTASTGPAVPPPVPPQTSSWDSKSLTGSKAAAVKAAAPAPAKTAAVAVPAAAAPVAAAKVKGGKYKVHIAAVRSKAEADALAQRLNAEHAAAFNSRTAAVDEAVIGSMGTFYRVRVGSYATPEEPRGLCNSLRNSGYDCLVVNN